MGASCEFQKFRGIGVLAFDNYSIAHAVSGDGTTVVGYSANSAEAFALHAVRFIGNGPLNYLATPTTSDGCVAYGVNRNGQAIVGSCFVQNPMYEERAFRYSPGGAISYVSTSPLPLATSVNALGISHDGNVLVGRTSPYLGVKWTAANGWEYLGRLSPNGESVANAANQDGSVIVGYDAPSRTYGWYWTPSQGLLELPRPTGAIDSYAADVNPDGTVIVGQASISDTSHAIRWKNLVPTDIGLGSATATNADGSVIVGVNNSIAMVWDSQGARQLSTLLGNTSDLVGWTLGHAAGISDDGKVIVGTGTHNGVSEGFVAHLP